MLLRYSKIFSTITGLAPPQITNTACAMLELFAKRHVSRFFIDWRTPIQLSEQHSPETPVICP